jgi:hypothetical protein
MRELVVNAPTRSVKPFVAVLIAVSVLANALLAWNLWFGKSHVQVSNAARDVVVMRTPGGLLEVSTVATEERFDSTTTHTILGVPVGETVAQIRVPATYRYHIPLATEWHFRVVDDMLVVIAPRVQPSLPVAIDTSRLHAFAEGLWAPVTGPDAMASLQRMLTAELAKKAASPQLILTQREAARATVGEFVRKWVLDQPRWKGRRPPTLLVFFEDEPLGHDAVPLLSATQ